MNRITRTVVGDRLATAPVVSGFVPYFVAVVGDRVTWTYREAA